MTMHKVLHPDDDVDRLYVLKKKDEEDLPAFKTASMHRYFDLETTTTKKNKKKRTATKTNTDNTSINKTKLISKQIWGENNRMDISSDKQAKSQKI